MEENKLENCWEFIGSPNYWLGRKISCTTLIYHYTADGLIDKTVKFFQQKDKTSAHFLIERDGKIIQMVKLVDRAWHAGVSEWNGKKEVNNFSVGIEICNWGPLIEKSKKYFCWPNNYLLEYMGENPFIDKLGKAWEPYPEAQIQALIRISKYILKEIPTIAKENIIGHEHIAPVRKQDPGPAFPWERVRAELVC
ncbi:MAG: N-acetylmuramoyl-L-alanine amidase [bacterium]|nr:N-acetylmuramoyl-L-alanine amidase [bacterium]